METISKLLHAAEVFGSSPLRVQGAGGNISEKNKDVMYVKASGWFLRDMKERAGYVACSYNAIADYLFKTVETPGSQERRSFALEAAFNEAVDAAVRAEESFGSPSMETGMHAVLSKYVFHTHNVFANILGCMKDGEKVAQDIFPRTPFAFVPYFNPGRELALEIARLSRRGSVPPILFLRNHGLLTHSDDFEKALGASMEVEKNIEAYLEKRGALAPFKVKETPADFSRHIFPDSVVYSQINFENLPEAKRRVFYEISSAVNYILDAIKKLGGEAAFLDAADVAFIKNMDKEKARIQMLKNS